MRGFRGLASVKVDFDELWGGIKEGISNIVQLTAGVKITPMAEDVYKLCTAQPHPYAKKLYLALRAFIISHVTQIAAEIKESDVDIIKDYHTRWTTFSTGMVYVHLIFRYLNMHWIKKTLDEGRSRLGGLGSHCDNVNTKDIYEVYTLALVVWRDLLYSQFQERLCRKLMEEIEKERNSEQVDCALIGQVIESFVKLGVVERLKPLHIYKQGFEGEYLGELRKYYSNESVLFMAENGVSAYMKKAQERLEEEEKRCKRYLDKCSYERVRQELNSCLIIKHREVLQVECKVYLVKTTTSGDDPDISDIQTMYHLLRRIVDGIQPMLVVLYRFVVSHATDRLKSLGKKVGHPREYCEVLLEVYELFLSLVRRAFDGDAAFLQTVDKALREVVNSSARSSELLAKYCDHLLKRGKNKPEGEALEHKLRTLVVLFRYLNAKDIFQKFYSKYLAKRLIYGHSVSEEAESSVLSHLQQVCGFEYTNKMQRMFQDMSICEDADAKLAQFMKENPKECDMGAVKFGILVLTQGSWPLSAHKTAFAPPPVLSGCQQAYSVFYDQAHSGRKLIWLHHLGKADIRLGYLKKRYTVTATDYQTGVLLLFNAGDSVTYEQCKLATNLEDNELQRTLASLVGSKLILLDGDSKEVAASSAFSLNRKYRNKHLKFKITSVAIKETEKDKKKTYKRVENDRKLFLQAMIVRIMKSRKQLHHNHLMKEVIAQASGRFQPSISVIKKQIEHLMEKEFIRRVEGETNQYAYIA